MRKFAFVFFAFCLLAGCTSKEAVPAGREVTIRICNDTKAVLDGVEVKWETGDLVGLSGCGYNNAPVSVNADGTFSISISEGGTLNAYYPYSVGGSYSVPFVQTNGDFDAMPQKAVPLDLTGSETSAEMWFQNQGSVARFNVYSSNASYQPEKIDRLYLDNSSTQYSLICNDGVVSASGSSAIPLDLVMPVGDYSGTLYVVTDCGKYSYGFNNKTFARSHIKPYNVNLNNGTRKRIVKDEINPSDLKSSYPSGATYIYDPAYGFATSGSNGVLSKIIAVGSGPHIIWAGNDEPYDSTEYPGEYGDTNLIGFETQYTQRFNSEYKYFEITGALTSVEVYWVVED